MPGRATRAWWRDPDIEDITILHLEGSLPEGATPLDLGTAEGSANHPFRAFGYPVVGKIEGLWATGEIKGLVRDVRGRQMLQLASAKIDRGISGGGGSTRVEPPTPIRLPRRPTRGA